MNNLIVFCVGVLVSVLVVYGIFTQVVSEMYSARNPVQAENQE
ncbi:MAG TPA: hypothetical protein PLP21_08785 [Pyrinomonadaceae bacterium]|nr:hypothetical protein [Pyrinomonadaceae bacterium]